MRLLSSRSILAILGAITSLSFFFNAMPQVALASQGGTRGGFPGRRVGGGSRSDCYTKAPLVALSPQTNFGRTTAAYPTVYFLSPSENKALKVQFVLKNAAGRTIARRQFVTEPQSGIIGIDLATVSQTGLDLDQNYQWYLSVACSQEQAQNLIVNGWIQRVDPDTQIAQVQKTPEAVRQAWKAGLWHDAIAALLQLRQAQPDSKPLRALWQEMLQSEGLPQVMADTTSSVVKLKAITEVRQPEARFDSVASAAK